MGKILDAFFKDELLVSTAPETRSPEHQKLCEKCNKLIDEMKEKLEGKEEEELFDALMENLFDEGCQAENFFFPTRVSARCTPNHGGF